MLLPVLRVMHGRAGEAPKRLQSFVFLSSHPPPELLGLAPGLLLLGRDFLWSRGLGQS